MQEFDVVVVGMGSGGLAAAITAHDAGASVLLLEKTPQHHAGGNSRVSGQVWFCPRDVEAAKRHLRAMCGEYPIAENVVEAWATETAGNTEWVAARAAEVRGRVPKDAGDPYDGDGTDFAVVSWGQLLRAQGIPDPPEHEYPEVEGNECGSEYHMIAGTMGHSRLWLTLRACAEDRGIAVRYETRVRRLMHDPGTGRVDGVVVEGPAGEESIAAGKGVVIASGGFAANPEMTRNYLRLSHAIPWGSPYNTGDGILLAQSVGADLAHPYNYMQSPGIAMPPYPVGQDAQPRGRSWMCVARDGRRFFDETVNHRHGKNPVRGTMDFHPGVPMWTVFDEGTRLAGPLVAPREFFPVDWMRQHEGYEWSLDNSAEIERGWVVRADSVRQLAEQLGIDADGLELQIEEFNQRALASRDDPHGRPAATIAPLVEPPFYGFEWAQLLITTLGGIRKDGQARAIDTFGAPIAGLYCCGDVASTYSWALSGGMGLGDAMAFGRIAGRHAASR